jgi:putative PIG3 family NAD(P)H quinone oxidoreductase
VLVRVRATALNRADILQRLGRYPAPTGTSQLVPGLEYAGEIVALGDDVEGWRAGERVFGIVAGGAHAELVAAHASTLARIPDGLAWEAAAAVPEAFITAHDGLVTQGALVAGERVMVHAVGSGVGLAVVQVARALGASVFGTARSADKLERARAYGMDAGFVAGGDLGALTEAARAWSGGAGVNVIADLVGGDYVPAGIRALAPRGRLVLIGLVAGSEATVPLRDILSKRLTIRGTALRSRTTAEKADATRRFADDVLPGLASGAIRPVVDRVLPLDRIREAHAAMERDETFGKIVLVP